MGVRPLLRAQGYNHSRYNPDEGNRRSAITASPKLQLPNKRQLDDISEDIEDVIDAKKENFTPKTDTMIATLVKVAAGITVLVIALFAAIAASQATGMALGFAAAAGGVALLLGSGVYALSYYLSDRAENRTKDQERVNNVHKAAIRNVASEKIHEFGEEAELDLIPAQRGRAAAPRAQQTYPARNMVQPSAPAPGLTDGYSAEELAVLGG